MKQRELSIWLRAIAAGVAVAVIALGFGLLPNIGETFMTNYPESAYLYTPILVFVWTTVLPVIIALILAWQIFSEIGKDNSFCEANSKRLKYISIMAVIDTTLYFAAAIIMAILGELRPGMLVTAICVVFMGLCMTVASAALSHLTKKAASLKRENDLTI